MSTYGLPFSSGAPAAWSICKLTHSTAVDLLLTESFTSSTDGELQRHDSIPGTLALSVIYGTLLVETCKELSVMLPTLCGLQDTAGSVVFANDNSTLFYVTKDKLDRPFKVRGVLPW